METQRTQDRRWRFYWACVSPIFKWLFLGYTALALITWIRDEFSPWGSYHVRHILPDWTWQTWLVIGVLIVAVGSLEGAWQRQRNITEAAKRGAPVVDARGRPYQAQRRLNAAPAVLALIIVCVMGLLWADVPARIVGLYLPAPKKLPGTRFPERGARIEVAKLTPVFNIPNRPLGVRIDFKNGGPIPALSVKYSTGLQVTTGQSPFPLTEQEIKNGIAATRGAAERQPETNDDHVQPNDGWFFIWTSPYINQEVMADLIAGKQSLYISVVAIYKDERLEVEEATVTEFCAFFVDKFKAYKSCPRNRIFIERRG